MKSDLCPSAFFNLSHYVHKELFADIKYVWEVFHHLKDFINAFLSVNGGVEPLKDVFVENPSQIYVGQGTRIEPGVFLKGPCWIGENCLIRHGAYVREWVLTGSHCVIGHGAEIKHSILLNRAVASHFNYVGDSILGNRVNLGAGAKCANVRLDRSAIIIRVKGEEIPTEMKKLGAIIGDGAQIGCNSVLNPGALIEKNTACLPCQTIPPGFFSSKAKL